MIHRVLCGILFAAVLAGCAGPRIGPAGPEPLDGLQAPFGDERGLVTVTRADLFKLDESLAARLRGASLAGITTQQKVKHVLALIFGADLRGFQYAAGHSTTASETWLQKRGDCLSLTVLTYSVARALDMTAQMQEVRVPLLFDRRGQLDVVNQHVNVLLRRSSHRTPEEAEPRDIVIDFEPEFASARPGKALSEEAILARYYNNIATEHLIAGRRAMASAHYKAAIRADAGFAAGYANLAVLYREAGQFAEAEQLLVRAVKLGDTPDVALHTLQELMQAQGRMAEARHYAQLLQSGRERDPYFWIGEGLRFLEASDARRAVAAFERARDMSHGFEELHRLLAVAYWRTGQTDQARRELAMLAARGDDEGVGRLKQKFKGSRATDPVPPM